MSAELTGFAEALLIGLIVGIQRESAHPKHDAGVRDFLLIALTGGICGFLDNVWLTAAALLSITALLLVFRWQGKDRSGITTEMSAIATFCLAVLTTTPAEPIGSGLAVGVAIVAVVFLEAKRSLHRFIRETITDIEFNDTLWYLAIIFIVYPILPEGVYGPYGAFSPRQIWLFVILVSSISYVGYFLQKFLGPSKGLAWTSVLGGLASTTASTLAFARQAKDDTANRNRYWSATVVANAIQFPRVAVILYLFNVGLARASLPQLLSMMVAGLLLGVVLMRRGDTRVESSGVTSANPFRLAPALKFGAVFAVVVFVSKAAAAEFGGRGLYWASALGGTVDADAVAVSLAALQEGGTITMPIASEVLYVALLMNAVLKTVLAFISGGAGFGWRVALGFLVIFGAGCIFWLL